MRHLGEHRVRDPVDALAAHLDQALGVAVHPRRHEVAADAGLRARAFGHLGRGVVRAAGAEVGHALDRVADVREQLGDGEVAHQVAPVELRGSAPASQRATISIRRDGRSSPSSMTSGRPAASRLPTTVGRTGAVVEQVAQLLLDEAGLLLDDEDLVERRRRTRRGASARPDRRGRPCRCERRRRRARRAGCRGGGTPRAGRSAPCRR